MEDHESGRTCSFAFNDKSIFDGEGCVQRRIVRDMDNVCHKQVKFKGKSDQETTIFALHHEVLRFGTRRSILVNSPVGESKSNGRVENTIRRVQDTGADYEKPR